MGSRWTTPSVLLAVSGWSSGSPSPASPWPVYAALPVAGLILIGGQLLAGLLFPHLTGIDVTTLPVFKPGGSPISQLDEKSSRGLALLLLMSQVIIVGLTLLTALHGGLCAVLRLEAPANGWLSCVTGLLGMVPILAILNLITYAVAPDQVAGDFFLYQSLARSTAIVPVGLAIGLGAPLSEELMFRGFLLSSLAATRLGFWPAAALTSFGWTLLHIDYSIVGLAEVFVIGIYFSWLLQRTGSVWPLLFCHAVYNSCLLMVLRFWPT